jgi:hypothetical protein
LIYLWQNKKASLKILHAEIYLKANRGGVFKVAEELSYFKLKHLQNPCWMRILQEIREKLEKLGQRELAELTSVTSFQVSR